MSTHRRPRRTDAHHADPETRSTFLPLFDSIAVRRLVLVDKHGRTRAELSTSNEIGDGEPRLSLFYSHGRFPALTVGIVQDRNGVERPVFNVEATNHEGGAVFELDTNGLPRFLLLDAEEQRIGQMTCADVDGRLQGLPNPDECDEEDPTEEGADILPLPVESMPLSLVRPRKPRKTRGPKSA